MKTEAEILGIKKETHDVKTFRLEPDEPIDFVPGQYCLVSIKDPEKDLEKDSIPLTYSSSPTRDFVELTVKKMGNYTSAMHGLEEGDVLILDGPRGESLTFDESVEKDVVFVAGGSGITPFISAIRYSLDRGLDNRMTLIYSNMDYRDIIYRTELLEIDSQVDRIDVINTLTASTNEHWKGEEGRVNRELIDRYVESPEEKLYYICGPPGMIDSVEEDLIEIGIDELMINYEKWQIHGKHDEVD